MPIEFGRRLNPSWDALRAKSVIGAPIDETVFSGGGLQNKIYVWHADASPLAVFDPTEAGVNAALAVCTWGDMLVIPSVNIIMSSGITLVEGLALIGEGENSVLSFSGFSGTAITMAAWSTIWNLGIRMISNGTTALAIDGQFGSVVIAPCFVLAAGGSMSNIGVKYGA